MRHDMSHMYALKSSIEELLGRQAWYDLKETTSAATWRKYVLKLLDAIELSVETTVLIKDDDWTADVRSNIAHGRDLARIATTPEDTIAALSGTLLRQVFLQLGAAPFNRSSDTTSDPFSTFNQKNNVKISTSQNNAKQSVLRHNLTCKQSTVGARPSSRIQIGAKNVGPSP